MMSELTAQDFLLEIMSGCKIKLTRKDAATCCHKLQQDWDGPYVIVKLLNDVVSRIRKLDNRFKVVYIDQLAPWNCDHSFNHGMDEDTEP